MKLSIFGKDFGSIIDLSENVVNKLFYDDDYFKPTKSNNFYKAEKIEQKNDKQNILEIYNQLKKIHSFKEQAIFLKNVEDNYKGNKDFYYNDILYSDCSYLEFRYYISWRTKWKQKQFEYCHLACLSLYLKELVFHIHDLSNDEIILEMINLVKEFEKIQTNKSIGTHVNFILSFIIDFTILNPVSFTYNEIQAKIGDSFLLFLPNLIDVDRNRYDKNLDALQYLSSYKFLKSPLLSSKYGYLFGGCLDYTFKHIEEYLSQYNVDFFEILFIDTIQPHQSEWHPYNSSQFFSFDKEQKFNVKTPNGYCYEKNNPYLAMRSFYFYNQVIFKDTIGFAIKLMESRLRENLGFTPKIKADPQKASKESRYFSYAQLQKFRAVAPHFATTEMINLIINSVDTFYNLCKLPKNVASKQYKIMKQKLGDYQIEETPINTEFDTAKFDNIRQDSQNLQQILVVEDSFENNKYEQNNDILNEATPVTQECNITQECVDETNEFSQLFHSLTKTEIECVKIICANNEISAKLDFLGNTYNLTAQTIIDSINEKALDLIGDNLIDSSDEPFIYEDYLNEVKNVISEG